MEADKLGNLMARVLLADDNKEVLVMLSSWLKFEDNLTVDTAADGRAALEFLRSFAYDVIVLDWEMPEMSGVDVCKEFRRGNHTTPVIMLTGRDSTQDKITGLDSGADDYMTKPFSAEELSARIRALLRRQAAPPAKEMQSAGVEIKPESHSASFNGQALNLSPTEFNLLAFFMENSNQIFAPEALVARVWGQADDASVAGVRTAVKRLRKKLEAQGSGCPLDTIRGSGYIWKT